MHRIHHASRLRLSSLVVTGALLSVNSWGAAAPQITTVTAVPAQAAIPAPMVTSNTFEANELAQAPYALHLDGSSWKDWTGLGDCGISHSDLVFGHVDQPVSGDIDVEMGIAYIQPGGILTSSMSVPEEGYWRLRFDAAQRHEPEFGEHHQGLQVWLNGEKLMDFKPPTSTFESYVTRPVFLRDSSFEIRFEGTATMELYAAVFDNVELEPVQAWTAHATWGGPPPTATELAVIPETSRVVIDDTTCVALRTTVAGELLGLHGTTKLATNGVVVRPTLPKLHDRVGLFEVGQALAPHEGSFALTLTGEKSQDDVEFAGKKFLVAQAGGRIHLHGSERSRWTRLVSFDRSTAPEIIVVEGEVNWRKDEFIVVAGSHHQDTGGPDGSVCRTPKADTSERAQIDKIIAAGGLTTITLKAGLVNHHSTAITPYDNYAGTTNGPVSPPDHTNTEWNLDQRAEVGLLTRSIKVEGGESLTESFGGHVMITQAQDYTTPNSELLASNVEFYNMGQDHRRGRYPLHWHMMLDRAIGQYVRNCSIHDSNCRAVTIHGTDGIFVENNVVWKTQGHAMFLEEGSEEDNEFLFNLVIQTERPELAASTLDPAPGFLPSDVRPCTVQNRAPSSFWITNPNNTFIGNVAAGTPGTGFWLIFPEDRVLGLSRAARGGDKPHEQAIDSYLGDREPRMNALKRFELNKAHGCGSGFDVNDAIKPGTHVVIPNQYWKLPVPANSTDPAAEIKDFVAYGCFDGLYTSTGAVGLPIHYTGCMFADNVENLRLGRGTVIEESVVIRDTGNVDPSAGSYRSGFVYYDGWGMLETVHFVGFGIGDRSDGAGYDIKGGQIIHTANSFKDITYPGNGLDDQPYIKMYTLADYDAPRPANASSLISYEGHPRRWAPTIRFNDTSPWRIKPEATAGFHTLTTSHPIVVTKKTSKVEPLHKMPVSAGHDGARMTPDRYGSVALSFYDSLGGDRDDPYLRSAPGIFVRRLPMVSTALRTRSEDGTDAYLDDLGPFARQPHRMFPAILRDSFEYEVTMAWREVPSGEDHWPDLLRVRVGELDPDDDHVIVHFKGIAKAANNLVVTVVNDDDHTDRYDLVPGSELPAPGALPLAPMSCYTPSVEVVQPNGNVVGTDDLVVYFRGPGNFTGGQAMIDIKKTL